MDHVEHIKNQLNYIPKKVLIYRAGVSEGQIDVVFNSEVKVILKDLESEYGNQAPKLTFVVVTKLLDDRFAVKRDGKLSNPNGGLIVHDGVVKDERANFFMVAQKVNQGTASPTHYDILINEAGYELAELEKLTFDLAHLYYNWQGPVKVPAPTQYA